VNNKINACNNNISTRFNLDEIRFAFLTQPGEGE